MLSLIFVNKPFSADFYINTRLIDKEIVLTIIKKKF